jgi:sulfur-oxidizing protein SoxY
MIARRTFMAYVGGLLSWVTIRPALAARPSLEEAVSTFAGGAAVQTGRVTFDVPPLAENGNSVGVTVDVESPMSEGDYVKRIAIINQKNPQAGVAVFHLTPRAGRAHVSTRIRLGGSQTVMAVAEMSDGSYWSAAMDVIVTIAACVESVSEGAGP